MDAFLTKMRVLGNDFTVALDGDTDTGVYLHQPIEGSLAKIRRGLQARGC